MTIKEAEERTGLSRSNIRFYESEGLIKPGRNTSNGYRVYLEKDIVELQKIAWLRTLGISIEDIRGIVEGQEKLYEVLERQVPLLERQISELQNARRMCEMLLAKGEINYENLEIEQYVDSLDEYWQENQKTLRLDTVSFVLAWGGRKVWVLLTVVSLLLALGALGFLPKRIPIQWSGGEAVSFADRWTILAYPAACMGVRFLLRPIIGNWVRRSTLYGSEVVDYVANCLCFAVFSAEMFMILFVKGIVRHIPVVFFTEIILAGIFLWLARRELPIRYTA